MAEKQMVHGHEVLTIVSADGRSRASFIPKRGGVCSSLIMPHGDVLRELLFVHDYFWEKELFDLPGGIPFLFPVCGRIERNGKRGDYLYDSHIFNMPQHGFAWLMEWEVLANDKADELTLRIKDNGATYLVYPFSFEVTLHYKITDRMLTCHQTYTNNSKARMPFYAGFHPYFLTLPAGQGKEEILLSYYPTRRFCYNDNYTDLIGERPVFELPISIQDPDVNEQLTQVSCDNNKVELIYPDHFNIQLKADGQEDFDMYPYVQLYTIPDKSFFCVEPWMGFPNAINTVCGVQWLERGESKHALLTLTATG